MTVLTLSVELETIAPPTITSVQFPPQQIEQLADLLLKVGDTVNPILLRRLSPIAYELLEGHFEYYAAMRAQEIDNQFTAIRAYVVPPEIEDVMLEQYRFLRSPIAPSPNKSSQTAPSDLPTPNFGAIEEAIANRLEVTLTAAIEQIITAKLRESLQGVVGQVTQALDTHLTELRQSVSPMIQAVAQNSSEQNAGITKTVIAQEETPKSKTSRPRAKADSKTATATKAKLSSSKKATQDYDADKLATVLHDLNTLNLTELENKLKQSAKGNTKFARLIHEQRSQQPFTSIADVVARVEKLGDKTLDKIIAAW